MLVLCMLGLFGSGRGDLRSPHCAVLAWGRWSACHGTHRRVRIVGGNRGCKVHVEHQVRLCGAGASPPVAALVAHRPAAPASAGSKVPPAHHCRSPWGAWGGCSRTCGIGERSRARSRPAQAACPALKLLRETQPCRLMSCPQRVGKATCTMSDWERRVGGGFALQHVRRM